MPSFDVPRDIWLHISQFIPPHDLRNLYAVNSAFFDVAMKLRYETLSVDELSDASITQLSRLGDPMVASRVRTLLFRPHHRFNAKQEREVVRNMFITSFLGAYHHFFTPFRFSSQKEGSAKKARDSSMSLLETTTKIFTKQLPKFTNVTEFRIDTWNIPLTFDLQPLLSTAWASFGKTLRVLSLGGNMQSFQVFAESSPYLVSLDELTLEFTNNLFRIDKPQDIASLLKFAPCINSFNLRSLTIFSWSSQDLSKFFLSLGPFPRLEKFCIRTAFNKAFRSTDAAGLSRLLANTPTLTHVELKLRPIGSALDQHTEDALVQWLAQTSSSSTVLTALHTLHIYPTMFPLGLEATKRYIERSSLTLRWLSLRDRYFWLNEVEDLLDALGPDHSLTALQMNVQVLSGELLDYLSSRLPSLRKLKLSIGAIRSESAEREEQFNPNRFRFHMQGRRYRSWLIEDIDLSQGGAKLDMRFMDLLAECIPSVTSYWGQGFKGTAVPYD
ncbi:hypothetical protein HGRIS_003875 [Hohenbuehelia grisea]|uniref:F-box domain-containing protein n=1 Tax=Hohenbuehelia grisea TaxID=104357 RepID=A0ABR3JGY3_9AGAR